MVYLISATYSAAVRNLSYSNKNLRNFNDFWNFSNDFETASSLGFFRMYAFDDLTSFSTSGLDYLISAASSAAVRTLSYSTKVWVSVSMSPLYCSTKSRASFDQSSH